MKNYVLRKLANFGATCIVCNVKNEQQNNNAPTLKKTMQLQVIGSNENGAFERCRPTANYTSNTCVLFRIKAHIHDKINKHQNIYNLIMDASNKQLNKFNFVSKQRLRSQLVCFS